MNFKLRLHIILLTGLMQCAAAVQAKDYAIEIILFANKTGLYDTAEQFAVNQVIPAPSNGIALENISPEVQDNELNEEPQLWRPLNPDEYILHGVANRLKKSGRYRILQHIAWRQPVVDKTNSQPILIRAGRDFSELFPERAFRPIEFSDTLTDIEKQNLTTAVRELDGTINIVIGRYIHLYTDLVYRLPRSNPTELRDALNRDQILVDYSIKSHRRMRSRELHYIDHPLVGVLIEATPIEEENE